MFESGEWVLIRKKEVVFRAKRETDVREHHAALNQSALVMHVGHENEHAEV